MAPRTVWTFNFTGWILFLVSAMAFTWTTWAAGDPVGLIATALAMAVLGLTALRQARA